MKAFNSALVLLLSAGFSAVAAQLCAGAGDCPAPSCALTYVEAKTCTDCSCAVQVAARTAAPEPRVRL